MGGGLGTHQYNTKLFSRIEISQLLSTHCYQPFTTKQNNIATITYELFTVWDQQIITVAILTFCLYATRG